jgi:hypothetical protein
MTAISRSRGRRAVRTTVVAGAVSLGLLALTACEKPSPHAHFTLGAATTSTETASDCYGHGEALGAERALECLIDTEDVASFRTDPGDTFRVGVDPSVAEQGWMLLVNGNLQALEPQHITYRSFPTDELYGIAESTPMPGMAEEFEDVVQVSIIQLADDFDPETLPEAYQQAQMGDLSTWEEEFFSRFEGVWNVQLEQRSH